MGQVTAEPIDNLRGELHLTDYRVAAPAQQAAHAAAIVAVVNDQLALGGVTEQATVPLRYAHRCDLVGSQAVLAHQSGAQVLRSRCIRVSLSPLTEPSVSSLAVSGTVLPIAGADAASALASPRSPRREVDALIAAQSALHTPSFSMLAANIDQPCHADVLLEIANA